MNPILQFFQNIVTLRGTYDWNTVFTFLFYPDILQGIIITVLLAVLAQFIGALIGLLLYFTRRSSNGVLRGIGELYVWFFRGTPLLVQILFLNAFLPYIGLARPLIQTHFFRNLGFQQDIPLDAFIAGLAALSLNEGAYMAEIMRAGIDSIDLGQLEAAKSLGMTYWLGMRRIVLPQALRVIIPPLGNEFNSMLKNTSLVSAISVAELLEAAQAHAFSQFRPLELLTVASIWYLVLTTIWTLIQRQLERKINTSNLDPALTGGGSWWKRMIGFGGRETGVPMPAGADHH